MVKLAVILSGRVGGGLIAAESICNFFSFEGVETSYFLFPWHDEALNIGPLITNYKPKYFETLIPDLDDFTRPPSISRGELSINTILMHNAIKQAFERYKRFCSMANKSHDIIVRSRFDLMMLGKLDWSVCRYLDDSTVALPDRYNYHGLNDQFALGNAIAMESYCSFYNYLLEFIDHSELYLNPEVFMGFALKKFSMRSYHFGIEYKIVRNPSQWNFYEALHMHDESSFPGSRKLGYVEHI